jgi:hypothetical protein
MVSQMDQQDRLRPRTISEEIAGQSNRLDKVAAGQILAMPHEWTEVFCIVWVLLRLKGNRPLYTFIKRR